MATRANKMDPRLIALCSATIGIVYSAGYYVTMPAVQPLAPQPLAASPAAPMPIETASGGISGLNTPGKPTIYANGTFEGFGSTEIGSVVVAVTIRNDQILDVQIARCSTRYSQKLIDQLPEQVLALQSHEVDTVSGATLSTKAFRSAIQNALAHARP